MSKRFMINFDKQYIIDNETGEQLKHLSQFKEILNKQYSDIVQLNRKNEELKYALIQEQEVSRELKSQLNIMIGIFNDSGIDYHISDELEDILKG